MSKLLGFGQLHQCSTRQILPDHSFWIIDLQFLFMMAKRTVPTNVRPIVLYLVRSVWHISFQAEILILGIKVGQMLFRNCAFGWGVILLFFPKLLVLLKHYHSISFYSILEIRDRNWSCFHLVKNIVMKNINNRVSVPLFYRDNKITSFAIFLNIDLYQD